MKPHIEKQVVLNGSYGISKPRPARVQSHLIAVYHVIRDGVAISTHASKAEARSATKR